MECRWVSLVDSNVASKALFPLNFIRDPMCSILIKDPANRSSVFLFNRTIGRKFCRVLHIHRNANVGRSWTRFQLKDNFSLWLGSRHRIKPCIGFSWLLTESKMNHRAIGFVLIDIQLVSWRYTATIQKVSKLRVSRKQNNKRIGWRGIFLFKLYLNFIFLIKLLKD